MAEPKTKLGNLDPKMASALCYLPVMYIHFIASIAFLAMEPKEHRMVRFHAAQGLLLAIAWILAIMVGALLWIFVPVVVMMVGVFIAAVLESDAIAGISTLLGVGLQFGLMFLFIAAAAVGPLALIAGAGMVMMDMPARYPVFAGLADRIVGQAQP